MKKQIFTLTLVFFINFLQAQNPLFKQWDRRFGGSNYEWLTCFQQTMDGGYILGGVSSSGSGGDKTQTSRGGQDYWIVKIDSVGNKLWDKRFGGADSDVLYSLKQTNDGGYILAGHSSSGISGDKTQDTVGSFDFWIIKIDSTGNKLWEKDLGGSLFEFYPNVQLTKDGGFIIGGTSYSGISGDKTQPTWNNSGDFWIVKTDSLGNKQWDKDFGGIDDEMLMNIQQTDDGGYIVGGWSYSDSTGDKTQRNRDTVFFTRDFWIVKIDSSGNKQWDKRFGSTAEDWLCSIIQVPAGGYMLGGWTLSNTMNGDISYPLVGGADYWIIKIDPLGNKIWDRIYGGNNNDEYQWGNLTLTLDGGYLLAAISYSNISGDKTENNLGHEQTWVVKIDSIGNKQWDKTLHTDIGGADDENGFAIQTKDGCFVMANYTSGGIGGDKTENSRGSEDFWIIKYCDTTLALIPAVSLQSSDTMFCEKKCIDFYDLSTNNPTSWQWFFPGADSSMSTMQNPTNICYNNYGSFDVSLIACNSLGCDTMVHTGFINVYPVPVVVITQSNDTLFSSPGFAYQWWSIDSGIISGATNSYFVPRERGEYFVIVTDSIGCSGTSNLIKLTGINNLVQEHLEVSPNPFTNALTFILNTNQTSKLNLYDITSRVIISQEFINTVTINTELIAKGIYLYEVENKSGVIKQGKVVKD